MEATKCGCGCGGEVRPGNRFVHGHNRCGELKAVRYIEQDRGYHTPCWIWQLALNNHGYPCVGGSTGRQLRGLAHRLYYERVHGPIPAGLVIDHLCRVPACVNPDHLEAVTQAENCRRGPGGRPAALTDEQAMTLRAMRAKGAPLAVLASTFGIAVSTACRYAKAAA
jgi:hypothetical protein